MKPAHVATVSGSGNWLEKRRGSDVELDPIHEAVVVDLSSHPVTARASWSGRSLRGDEGDAFARGPIRSTRPPDLVVEEPQRGFVGRVEKLGSFLALANKIDFFGHRTTLAESSRG